MSRRNLLEPIRQPMSFFSMMNWPAGISSTASQGKNPISTAVPATLMLAKACSAVFLLPMASNA